MHHGLEPVRFRSGGGDDQLWTPPAELRSPPPRLHRILSVGWIICLALAIFAQAGATWLVYSYRYGAEPTFASVGLISNLNSKAGASYSHIRFRPGSDAVRAAGIGADATIDRIDGVAIPEGMGVERLAALLAGPDGAPVAIALSWPSSDNAGGREAGEIRVVRSAENREQTYTTSNRIFRISSQVLDVLIALLLIGVASVLRWRRFHEPVAVLLSFALLFLAMVGTWRLWALLGIAPVEMVFEAAWLGLFLVALPAFPSGRYTPSWSRWSIIVGPAAAVAMVLPSTPQVLADLLRGLLYVALLVCVVVRFQQTPPGPERQQMKWAALAFAAAIILYAAHDPIIESLNWIGLGHLDGAWTTYLNYALERIAFIIIPLGLLVSLLDYRLNDADAAIGRSAGYALVTTFIGVIWAVSTLWINKGITQLAGSGNTALATAISTVVALSILSPARTRVMSWTEAKFQRALVRLRGLPKRISRWQHDDNPELVAAHALAAVVDGVNAVEAALIEGEETGELKILSTHEVRAEDVAAQLGSRRPVERSQDRFPLRIVLKDDAGPVATLLLGRRSDGASYSKDERSAITLITEPLADALRASSRRARRNAEFEGTLAEIRTRLEEVEAAALLRRTRAKAPKLAESR